MASNHCARCSAHVDTLQLKPFERTNLLLDFLANFYFYQGTLAHYHP